MSGVAGVTARISQIQGHLLSVGGVRPTAAVKAPPATTGAPSFAAAYTDAVAATGSTAGATTRANTAITTAAATPTGATKLSVKGVPLDLIAYGNGKVPASALASVGGTGHRLWAPAAASMESMIAAARRDGASIGITDSYRPYAEQVDLARRKGLYSQGGLAARPGTSDHGWGMAVDLRLDPKAQAWMRANGGRFGFVENTPREPWHWVYRPVA